MAETITQQYQKLKTLKGQFISEHALTIQDSSKVTDLELTEAKRSLALLQRKRDLLYQRLWPFKEFPQTKFQEQYEFQRNAYEELGISKTLSTGEKGIIAINNTEYPFPSIDEVSQTIRTNENKELLKIKLKQFDKPLFIIVPFGMKLDDLIAVYKQVLWKHYKEKKLFSTMKNPQDKPRFPDDLPFDQTTIQKIKDDSTAYDTIWKDKDQSIWVWDKYMNADVDGKLVYHPKEFSSHNHQGQTKTQLLTQQGAWSIIFIENMPNIPRKDKGDTIGNRPQIATNGTSIKQYIKQGESIPSPSEYLNALYDSPLYQGESGMTPEEQLIYAILHLIQTNQVIDDYQGAGAISYQIGAYFPASGHVPRGYWDRDDPQMNLSRHYPDARYDRCGLRPAVKLKLPPRKHV